MKLKIGDCWIRDWELSDADALLRYADNPKIAANLRDVFPSTYKKDRCRIVSLQGVRTDPQIGICHSN